MSKLKTKLAKMFFNLAERMDKNFVEDKTIVMPGPSLIPLEQPIIMYDKYHVEKIHAQHMLSRDTLMFSKNYNMDEYVSTSIVRSISEELMKLYGDSIKTEDIPEGRIYSLDVYVCKPTKKETI
jgi:hypothetical protein